jgi:hypothetical protein
MGFNPYKIGPFGEPIRNGLLGRFPTLRKDDGDVKSSRPPPPPPPGSVGYVTVGGRFSAFSRLRILLKKQPKTPVKPPWNDESGHAYKNSLGRL